LKENEENNEENNEETYEEYLETNRKEHRLLRNGKNCENCVKYIKELKCKIAGDISDTLYAADCPDYQVRKLVELIRVTPKSTKPTLEIAREEKRELHAIITAKTCYIQTLEDEIKRFFWNIKYWQRDHFGISQDLYEAKKCFELKKRIQCRRFGTITTTICSVIADSKNNSECYNCQTGN